MTNKIPNGNVKRGATKGIACTVRQNELVLQAQAIMQNELMAQHGLTGVTIPKGDVVGKLAMFYLEHKGVK